MFAAMIRTLFRRFTKPARPYRRLQARRKFSYRPWFEIFEDRLVPDAVFWKAAVSGTWNDPSKWSTGMVPGPMDTAIIAATGADYTVTLDVNRTVAGFTLNSSNAAFFGSGRTFTMNGPGTLIAGTVLWRSSAWAGTGTLTNNSSITIQGASTISCPFEQDGSVLIQGSSLINTSATLTVAGGLSNHGTITLESQLGSYADTLTGAFTNAEDGTIQVNRGDACGTRALNGNITNLGAINVGASIHLTVNGGSTAATFTNQGQVTVAATGMMTIGQTFTNNGTLNVQSGGTLSVTGTFTNFMGTMTLTDGTYLIAGTFRLPTANNIVTNAATIVLDGINSNIYRGGSGTQNALASFASNSGSFTLQNGRSFTTTGDFSNNGTLGVGSGSTFVVNGSLTNIAGGTLTDGTWVIGGSLAFTDADIQVLAATLVLDGPSAEIIDRTGGFDGLRDLASITDAGNFTIQNGAGFSCTGDFGNAGSLTIGDNSTFTATGSYSQTAGTTMLTGGTLAATVSVMGGTLTGSGTISGDVTNAGLIEDADPGLTITGDLTTSGAVTVSTSLTVNGNFLQTDGTTALTNGILNATVSIAGGTLTGSGTISGDVTNAGLIEDAAPRLTIAGSLTNSGTVIVGTALTVTGSHCSRPNCP